MSIPRQTATMLPLAQLVPHPNNVRKQIGDISELAASIRQNGLVQPIVVTQRPNRIGQWLILAGHRRAKAAERVGLAQVPCIIRHDVGHLADHLSLMLVENCQRTNLGPVEKAEALRELIDLGLTQAEIARTTGMHASTVNALLLITELDEQTIEAVRAGELTAGAAQEAVRKERAASRERMDTPTRGRPIQVEPPYFTRSHPLAAVVRDQCDHSTRPKLGAVGCGQCWEQAIRDESQGIGGGVSHAAAS
ncbi:ParB/RepB/Spo0J family partition protein [Aeromicrobium sp. 9AM]|uniref:ParB/RepB/Spo0J family partition protein n=1 Tax=Aeromicrobium sp. 9AM TaxID=2653126 RepID=UPI0012F0E770|nr:ParB/RepB/Spo0J family partition protein [Aeromicrobium sp. 9AM]VXB82809.1 ParB-like protein [Aeromicrobium sp. 9AM]